MERFIIRKQQKTDGVNFKEASTSDSESETEKSRSDDVPSQSKQKKRKFRREWLEQFHWLQNKNESAFCNVCEKELLSHLSHLKRHAQNNLHCQNTERKKNQIQMDTILSKENQSLEKQIRHAELTLVMFCIMHNLPFLLMDFLPNLLFVCCPDSQIAKSLKCGRTKATQLAEVLGSKAKSNIVNALKTTKFSMIVDETTDLSSRKSLVVVVRYFDTLTRSIKDRFLSLIELAHSDAESIYQAITLFFVKNDIPIKNLIGLATDGANTMAGNLNSLKTKLKDDVDFFYLKCTCHSLHLCSSYACKKLPEEIEQLCRDIYKFFAYSSKRINEFKEFQDYCNVKPHKILGIALTRWLSLENVILRIIEQWDALQLYFLSCCLEVGGVKSSKLANTMSNFDLKVYMLFLSYILKIINNLNKEFQSENVRLPFLYSQLEINFKLLLCNYMDKDYINRSNCLKNFNINDQRMFLRLEDIFIGTKAEKYLQSNIFSNSQRMNIKLNIRNFYIELLKQIQDRFDFGREDLKDLLIITPSKVMSENKISLLPLINHFNHLIECDPDVILTQWRLLQLSNLDLQNLSDIALFWEKIRCMKNGLGELCFNELTNFINSLMCLPHSSAAAERKFFDLSLIKTKLRNNLEFKTLNDIMLSKELCVERNKSHYIWSAKEHF